ncbi:hypothetical protein D9M69_703790 [compost metagenome]
MQLHDLAAKPDITDARKEQGDECITGRNNSCIGTGSIDAVKVQTYIKQYCNQGNAHQDFDIAICCKQGTVDIIDCIHGQTEHEPLQYRRILCGHLFV